MKIVIPIKFYSPAYKAGGPIRSVTNIVDFLSETVEFEVITTNRDLDESEIPGIHPNVKYENPSRVYLEESGILGKLKVLFHVFKNSSKENVLYLNSLFEFRNAFLLLLLYKFKVLRFKRVVLAPRGQLIEDALSSKGFKKEIFLKVARFLGLYDKVTFHATSQEEATAIGRILNKRAVLCDVIPNTKLLGDEVRNEKTEGQLNCIYSARVHPHKNLLFMLQRISEAEKQGASISLDVFGLVEDERYFQTCSSYIEEQNLKVKFHGAISYDELIGKIARYDLFLLPTLSENFGHSIAEALSLGVPVLISDRTPFRELSSKGIGFDLPLTNTEEFVDKLCYFNSLPREEMQNLKNASKNFMFSRLELDKLKNLYLRLFKVEHV